MRRFTAEEGVSPRRRFNAAVRRGFDAYVLAECLLRLRRVSHPAKGRKPVRRTGRSKGPRVRSRR